MKTLRFAFVLTCLAALGLLFSPDALSAQQENNADLPDMAVFVKAYRRANPWAPQPGRHFLYKEAVYVNAANLQMGVADPLAYLYAHGYAQSLSGTQFYRAQQDIARQFTYGPLGNPHSIPHLTNYGYNMAGIALMPCPVFWDVPVLWSLPVGAASPSFNNVQPRRDFTLPTESTGQSPPQQERGTTAPTR